MLDISILNKLSNIKVLLVEDDEDIAQAIMQSLQICTRDIVHCSDGLSGYECFMNGTFDVVISDINLPSLNGLDMLKSIQEISPHTPFIIITSYDSNEHILKSIYLGAHSYLRKPFRIEELQTSLLMATKNLYADKINLQNGLVYDKLERLVYKNDKLITLTKQESKLLYLLVSNANRILSYETIENFVWRDKSMSSEALRMCIKKIRLKLPTLVIENFSGSGYMLNLK